jgi:hypothetical protein
MTSGDRPIAVSQFRGAVLSAVASKDCLWGRSGDSSPRRFV